MDSVQMLDNLNVGAELEEWPLHRDLTLSPPLKSQPITLEQDGDHLTLKSNSVSPRYLITGTATHMIAYDSIKLADDSIGLADDCRRLVYNSERLAYHNTRLVYDSKRL